MTCIGNRGRSTLFFAIVFICGGALPPGFAQGQRNPKDSVSKSVFLVTPRLNSAGYFPFTGAYINKNLNADINLFYERNQVGFFLFKSQDLEDSHSVINYFQPGIFKKFRLSQPLQVALYFGYLFSQTASFRDSDSDYYTAVAAYWTISSRMKLENTALFFDLTHSEKMADRILLSYTAQGFKLDFYVWQRVVFETNAYAASASMAVNFPKIKLTGRTSLQTTFSYMGYLTRAKPDYAMRDGFLFTIAVPVSLAR